MTGGNVLETLREVFKDQRIHLSLAVVEKLELADDRSFLNVLVNLVPDQLTIVAQMSWQQVGPDAGIYGFPVVGDAVIVAFMEGDEDAAYVISRLSSQEDKIPVQAVDGDTVVRALSGKKSHILSDSEILLGRGGSDPTEPLVLGAIFKQAYSNHLGLLQQQANTSAAHKHIGNLGFLTAPPDLASDFTQVASDAGAIQSSPVDDEAMLSDLSKTEK
jgi:hypothetical protein